MSGPTDRNSLRRLAPEELRELQLERLGRVLASARQHPFYAEHLRDVTLPLQHLDQLTELPLLTKPQLLGEQRGEPARIFAAPSAHYTRLHQTSGTQGWPMPVLDTDADWQWWLECWQYVLDAANATPDDVAMMAFSFGPFIGFWTAHEALVRRGAMVVPGGGMSSEARLQTIADYRCTIICCTPTYALHLAAVAQQAGFDLASGPVTRIVVAGEPGGSVPEVRQRIEGAWGARVIDHTGASEVGAWGFGSDDGQGVHVIESEFIAELLRFDDDHPDGTPAGEGEPAELVLTNLGRLGGPAIRYRTGDIVRGFHRHDRACRFLWLDGGVLGRSDDMMVVRGVNIFPSSIEAIVREVEPAAEFRMIATRQGEMDQLSIEIEATADRAETLARRCRDRLAMRVHVATVDEGTLPRFEAKSRRWIDRRRENRS